MPLALAAAQFSNSKAPKADDKVVYIDGAFDLFHIGHVEILERAKVTCVCVCVCVSLKQLPARACVCV